MRPLVAVRRAAPFDPRVFLGGGLLWPLTRAADALRGYDDFPPVEALVNVFDESPPVHFVVAAPRRRRKAAFDATALYDARITLEHTVPTRARCWHDLMNALVWGTFPRAKRALHARQYRAISERLEPGATVLPPARTRELDALALLDEGGVALMAHDPPRLRAAFAASRASGKEARIAYGSAEAVIFGHAIYESLALGVAPAIVAAIVLERDEREGDVVRDADQALTRAIEDAETLRTPADLTRIDLAQIAPVDGKRVSCP